LFHSLLAAPAETAQRHSKDPLYGQGLTTILTKAKPSRIDAYQCFPDVLYAFPIPFTHAQGNDPVQLNGCPVKGICHLYSLFPHFLNRSVACSPQFIYLSAQDMLDKLDLFALHLDHLHAGRMTQETAAAVKRPPDCPAVR